MICARPRPDQLMFAARSRHCPVVTLRGGRPGKTEQPRNTAGFTPSAITSPSHLTAFRAGSSTQIRQGDAAHPSRDRRLPEEVAAMS
jgi:hypothetical protein